MAEDRVGGLEARIIINIQTKVQRLRRKEKKKKKRNGAKETRGTQTRMSNIHVSGVPDREERKSGQKHGRDLV